MKTCKKCSHDKLESDFGKDCQKRDGLNTYCKVCIRNRNRKCRLENPESLKKYFQLYRIQNRESLRKKALESYHLNREKRNEQNRIFYEKNKVEICNKRRQKMHALGVSEERKDRQKLWRIDNAEQYRLSIRLWQARNREKINVHAKVHRAVKNGSLVRKECCERCGLKCKTEGHHKDYSKPLDVMWLCRKCHAMNHRKAEV